MQIIPVLDIQNGIVVHGVGGRRDQYRPIRSTLAASCDPSVIVRAFMETFGFETFYIADLDGIMRRSLNRCVLAELTRFPASFMVDAGISSPEAASELIDLGVDQVIVALETLPDRNAADTLIESIPPSRLSLSLDLRDGVPVSPNDAWQQSDPLELAHEFIGAGFSNFIVLDVASVGSESGTPTLDLCRRLRSNASIESIVTGGGVTAVSDIQTAADAGVDGLLIASALHSGKLQPQDIQNKWNSPTSHERSC